MSFHVGTTPYGTGSTSPYTYINPTQYVPDNQYVPNYNPDYMWYTNTTNFKTAISSEDLEKKEMKEEFEKVLLELKKIQDILFSKEVSEKLDELDDEEVEEAEEIKPTFLAGELVYSKLDDSEYIIVKPTNIVVDEKLPNGTNQKQAIDGWTVITKKGEILALPEAVLTANLPDSDSDTLPVLLLMMLSILTSLAAAFFIMGISYLL